MTTCVGLLTSCSEFFSSLTPKINYSQWLLFLTLFALGVSNFGLSAILSISVPVLNMIYPMALVLILALFTIIQFKLNQGGEQDAD